MGTADSTIDVSSIADAGESSEDDPALKSFTSRLARFQSHGGGKGLALEPVPSHSEDEKGDTLRLGRLGPEDSLDSESRLGPEDPVDNTNKHSSEDGSADSEERDHALHGGNELSGDAPDSGSQSDDDQSIIMDNVPDDDGRPLYGSFDPQRPFCYFHSDGTFRCYRRPR